MLLFCRSSQSEDDTPDQVRQKAKVCILYIEYKEEGGGEVHWKFAICRTEEEGGSVLEVNTVLTLNVFYT